MRQSVSPQKSTNISRYRPGKGTVRRQTLRSMRYHHALGKSATEIAQRKCARRIPNKRNGA